MLLERKCEITKQPASVVIILKLVPHSNHDDIGGRLNFNQCNVARTAERDHQLAQKRACPGFATGKRRSFERCKSSAYCLQCMFCQLKIAACARQLAFEYEVKQTVKVGFGLAGQPNFEIQLRAFEDSLDFIVLVAFTAFIGLTNLARAASSFCCNLATTSSAST